MSGRDGAKMRGRFVMRLVKDYKAGYIDYEVEGKDLPAPYASFRLEGYSPCDKEECVKKHIRTAISAPARMPKHIRDVVESLYGHLMAMHKEFWLDSYSIGAVLEDEEGHALGLRIVLTRYEDDCDEDEECRPARWEVRVEAFYEGFEELHKLKVEAIVGRASVVGGIAEVDAELLRRAVFTAARQIYNAYAYATRKFRP